MQCFLTNNKEANAEFVRENLAKFGKLKVIWRAARQMCQIEGDLASSSPNLANWRWFGKQLAIVGKLRLFLASSSPNLANWMLIGEQLGEFGKLKVIWRAAHWICQGEGWIMCWHKNGHEKLLAQGRWGCWHNDSCPEMEISCHIDATPKICDVSKNDREYWREAWIEAGLD